MNLTQKILCILFIFGLVIIITNIHSIAKKRKIRAEEKLKEDAKRYFVTICHKLLTPFGDAKSANDFISFKIYGDHFFALHVVNGYHSKSEVKALLSIKFRGFILFDQRTQKEYSYGAFETYLNEIVGDSLVYDFYIEHLWNEMKKEETVE